LLDLVLEICRDLLDQIDLLTGRIDALKKKIDALSWEAEASRRLQTMPGVGPIAALAIETFAPPMETFKCGRDFAAWLVTIQLAARIEDCFADLEERWPDPHATPVAKSPFATCPR
jgi:hypothetical protein